jgi:hypothetical protein
VPDLQGVAVPAEFHATHSLTEPEVTPAATYRCARTRSTAVGRRR